MRRLPVYLLLICTSVWSISLDVTFPSVIPLRDFAFMTETHGVALDDSTGVYYTADRGVNWTSSFTLSAELDFYNNGEVLCPDEQTAFFITRSDGLYKSTNQGKTWNQVHSVLQYDDISFANVDTGFIVKSDTLFVTFDGGETWRDTTFYDHINDKKAYLKCGAASSPGNWAVSAKHTMFFTDDAGKSWYSTAVDSLKPYSTKKRYDTLTVEPLVVDSSNYDTLYRDRDIELVYFTSADSGFFFFQYETYVYYTINGGAEWISTYIPSLVRGQDAQQFGDTIIIAPDYSHSTFPISYDRGQTWRQVRHGTDTDDRAYYLSPTVAWKYDIFSVTLVHTTDNWETWEKVDNGTGGFRWGVWFFDTLRGICYGGDGLYWNTTDGHETWESASFPDKIEVRDWAFIDSTGFLGAYYPSLEVENKYGVYRTTDRGVTWTGIPGTGEDAVYEIDLVGDSRVFAMSKYNLFYSPDKGETWQERPLTFPHKQNEIVSFLAFSEQELLTVTNGKRYFTSEDGAPDSAYGLFVCTSDDGGVTWSDSMLESSSGYGDLAQVNSTTAYLGRRDGVLMKTEDRGATWTTIENNVEFDFSQIMFVDHNRGFTYNEGGIFGRTFDGGKTWDSVDVREKYNTDKYAHQSLRRNERLFILDANHVWCAGPDMTTFRYTRHLRAGVAKTSFYPGERLTADIDGHNTNALLVQYRRAEGEWKTIDSIAKADDIRQTWGYDIPVGFLPGDLTLRFVDVLDSTLVQYADVQITNNLPPVFTDQIADTVIIPAQDTLVLYLAALFTDPEGHAMTFGYSGPDWATSVGTDSVMLAPVIVGDEESITLSATDTFGGKTEVTLFIQVDEVGTSIRLGRLVYARPRFLGVTENGTARIVFSQTEFTRGKMTIYNLQGRTMARKTFEIEPGIRVYEIPLGSFRTAQGRYFVIVDDARTRVKELFSVLR